ncbi:uncharacterized protein LOC128754381 isoform X1 [Synchiropus splendidus]|uniref:uncharacterized protein LOC128754381 isoform X1 n=2 Tax=Synchiropus splendidus TaxID=270530 RepID=UPI00237DC582|nr:uncharacterized protein LOC128754381 isoform X1 [Synchiropus splendidus]
MKPLKSMFLKTYGRQRMKVSGWLTPVAHRKAFDSSASSDSDDSIFLPKAAKTKRRKRVRQLKTDDVSKEESQPIKQRKTVKAKKSTTCSGETLGNAKRKAILDLPAFENSSDEENVGLVPSCHAAVRQHHVIRVPPPRSVGCFVTRRRRSVFTKPHVLNSSDEFTSQGRDFKGFKGRRPSEKKQKCPRSDSDSPAEIVAKNMGASFLKRPFQEISLNQSDDHSLESCTKKPIFCSTPSANLVGKLSCLGSFSMIDQSLNAPSTSLSCVDLQSPFQGSVGSPPLLQTFSTKENVEQDSLECNSTENVENASADLFEVKSMELGKGPSDDIKNVGLSVTLHTSDSESSSRFVLAANELVTYDLKEQCLTHPCSVQLERIDLGLVFNQSTYLSCLECSSPINSPEPQPLSCDPHTLFNSNMSVTEDEASHHIKSMVYTETCQRHDPLIEIEKINVSQEIIDTQSTVNSSKVSVKQSVLEKSQNLHCSGGTNALSSVYMDIAAPKDKIRTTDCQVQLKQLDLSPFKEFRPPLSCTCPHSLDMAEQMQDDDGFTPVRLSIEGNCEATGCQDNAVVKERRTSNNAQIETLDNILRMKCITDNAVVRITRAPLSQLQKMLSQRQPSSEVSYIPTDVQVCGPSPKLNSEVRTESTSSQTVRLRKRSSAVPITDQSCATRRNKPLKKPNRRNTSTDRSGTSRKAGVSGLSVSRWKNKGNSSRTLQKDDARGLDNSIVELISKQHKQTLDMLKPAMGFSTPLRAGHLKLSGLPSDTHTWSQLKAALSVHRKGKVLLSPRVLHTPFSPGESGMIDVSRDLFATPFRTPLPKHLRSQLLSNDSMSEEDLSDAEKVFAECNQQRPLPWQACVLPVQMEKITKIGEGTFGEVFSTTNAAGETVALKVIPVEGTEKVNGEDQKTFGEILHEIIISKELSSLKEKQQNHTHGFIGLHDLHCVQGCYPPQFLKTWDDFDQAKGSENDRPDFFGEEQLFIILEYEFGGVDLENSNGKLPSINTAKSILHQVTAALAVAEQELHFEHRDLHWGNILVKKTSQKTESYLLQGAAQRVETGGVLVRIIDYSLSRLEIDGLTVSCDISNDEELFQGLGDYQFDIYRLMRQENGNNWSVYHPHTNVLWLHYLCSKLLTMEYRNSGGKAGKKTRTQLTCFQKDLLKYSSAMEALEYFN